MRLRVLTTFVLPIVLAVTACSGGGGSTGADGNAGAPASTAARTSNSTPTDPCALVTESNLTTLFGVAPGPIGPTDQFRGQTCSWEVSNDAGSSLELTVWPGREFFLSDPSAVQIADLGDEAYYDPSLLETIMWRQGDVTAQLIGFGVGEPAQTNLVAVAREISGRLAA
jgi:Protein of unknown function (DUF3558)